MTEPVQAAPREKSMIEEMKDDLMKDFIESVGPSVLNKLGPFIKPAMKQLSDELGNDEKFLVLRKDKKTNMLYFCVISTNTIKAFDLSASPDIVLPIIEGTEFIERLLKGELMKPVQ